MTTKRDLDTKVAACTGMGLSEISLVTSLFLRFLALELGQGRAVRVTGFGTFTLRRQKLRAADAPPKLYVHVRKSGTLLRVLRNREPHGGRMEKFGVDQSRDQSTFEKAAAHGCPVCGASVSRHGEILICPRCGTEPFEKKTRK